MNGYSIVIVHVGVVLRSTPIGIPVAVAAEPEPTM
jgi:hypothetical protein